MSLQSSLLKTPEQALAAFQNSRERIFAMSLVHEELYKSMDYSRVDMEEYVGKLLSQLSVAYGQERRIGLDRRVENVELNVNPPPSPAA
ncbi:MAG: hypothetical protein MZU95_08885 [Desulfomicrobium escambiense]|nr:hypothetical protein [Desulfomicrobium escambiense]